MNRRYHAVVHDGRRLTHVVVGGTASGGDRRARIHDLEVLARVVGVGWHGDPFGAPLPKRRDDAQEAEAGSANPTQAARRDRGNLPYRHMNGEEAE